MSRLTLSHVHTLEVISPVGGSGVGRKLTCPSTRKVDSPTSAIYYLFRKDAMKIACACQGRLTASLLTSPAAVDQWGWCS